MEISVFTVHNSASPKFFLVAEEAVACPLLLVEQLHTTFFIAALVYTGRFFLIPSSFFPFSQ